MAGMNAKTILVPLADGFEESEAVIVVDVLRRAGFEVLIAGLSGRSATGSHRISVATDCLLSEISPESFDAIVLPGGMPGSVKLRESSAVEAAALSISARGGLVAAICAAPMALAKFGLLKGRKATCYPGFEDQLLGAVHTGARVERDGLLVTGKGAGTAFEFAAAVCEALGMPKEAVQKLMDGMIVKP